MDSLGVVVAVGIIGASAYDVVTGRITGSRSLGRDRFPRLYALDGKVRAITGVVAGVLLLIASIR